MVNVIGLGYIGLPTALMLAAHGVKVMGTDYNKELVNILKSGRLTFEEKGLELLFQKSLEKGVEFSINYSTEADVYIVSVPTPYDKASKKIDPSFVIKAMEQVLTVCKKGTIIVIESTVSPGTIDRYIRPIIQETNFIIGEDIHLVHAPERIIPGNMVYELINNSRTIGADNLVIGERVKEIYASFCKGEIIVTDIRTAEMTKVIENTYRDINIAFANELTKICRSTDMDVHEIIRIANKHPRVNILSPGPGVGGHCISVDPWFLVGDYPELANIIRTARGINDSMPEFVLKRIVDIAKQEKITDMTRIGIYGLTYKENVDDVRESPTLQLLENLEGHLASGIIKIYDPFIKSKICKNQYDNFDAFLEAIDMLVIMVGHDEIKENMNKLKSKVILDTRNISTIEGTYRL